MTREQVIAWAREAGLWPSEEWYKEYGIKTPNEQFLPELEEFAALIADAEAKRIYEEGMVTVGHMREAVLTEREACAKVCEGYTDNSDSDHESHGYSCAAAIRARGQA